MTDERYLYPVVAGRCPCCGLKEQQWTAPRIIDALRAWTLAHGRAPRKTDLVEATVDCPSHDTVYRMFGTMKVARAAAGIADYPVRVLASRCHAGHEWTDANTYWYRGRRECRACRAAAARRLRRQRVTT